jgi:hypothetical protein
VAVYKDMDPDSVVRPDIEGGLVISGSDAVLAGNGDFWYWISFYNVYYDTSTFEPIMVEIANAIAL